ncbi:MAG: excinuclease ABC subunit UvrA [SAR324 cluster bacterium]|nr:excinuclease ABC subunit UvrA [SAR324 cluster bacterium]
MTRTRETGFITVVGASEHNLRNVSISLPRDTLTVFTGLSGSGKSSLAYDTIFKEGQRRFLESLSPYARQFLGQMEKPRVEHVEGLSPTVSIDQKTVNRNPRSTVGTITELYDHYRLLMARLGEPHCPKCNVPIATLTTDQIVDRVMATHQEFGAGATGNGASANGASGKRKGGGSNGSREAGAGREGMCLVFAPMVRERKGEYRKELAGWLEQGFLRARVDGEIRRLDEEIALARYEKHTLEVVLDRFALEKRQRTRLAEAVEKSVAMAGGLVRVEVDGSSTLYSNRMACPRCQLPVPELEPRLFSFNDPQGACETCNGLGTLRRFTEERLTHPDRPLVEGALTCFTGRGNLVFTDIDVEYIVTLAGILGIDREKPWGRLPAAQRRLLLEGNHEQKLRVRNVFRNPRLLLEQARADGTWPGLVAVLRFIERFVGSALERYQSVSPCPDCEGRRLNPVALAVRFRGHNIHTLAGMTVEEAVPFFDGVDLSPVERIIGKDIFREIKSRLGFLDDVGVGYLTLARRATSLSGGEAQRIRLASQVGSGLQGVLYVLDEPSIGLHQTDNRKLIKILQRLRDAGNTVFVVEHDEETIYSADHVVDLGPGAGGEGGRVLAQGTVETLKAAAESISGRYLSGALSIPVPATRRKAAPGQAITVHGARRHNLRDLTVKIPLGVFVAVTGVSGSGKSTLVHDILKPALSAHLRGDPVGGGRGRDKDFTRLSGLELVDKVIEIDQSPIGRTPRSNPATYTKVLDCIRGLFASVPEAKIRGYKPGRFSFNVKGGRCAACDGAGLRTIEMQFLSNVEVICEECGGRRFNEETLQIHYKGHSIRDVLEMSVDEAAECFANVPAAARILDTLRDVGLGYIKLGQPSTTLSGGEAQRIKLASQLRKQGTGRTLYLLDEPTTGLHFHDIRTLLDCLGALVEQGNTVLVIEHNLDVIKVADWVIDLGPGGGKYGGRLVAEGTPEQLAKNKDSLTGKVLAEMLAPRVSRENGARPLPRKGKRDLVVRGAEQHNLKHIDVTIPADSLTVITGVSGSGKTSLAFDTIFAEGQARYVESLSTYARRFLGRMDKARVDGIDGLAPAIAIDQKNTSRSPRSTVATTTEIYDYLRLLYARVGRAHCPHCGKPLEGYNPTRLAREVSAAHQGARLMVTAPLFRPGSAHAAMLDKAEHLPELARALMSEGFTRLLLGGKRKKAGKSGGGEAAGGDIGGGDIGGGEIGEDFGGGNNSETVEIADWLARPAAKGKLGRGESVDLVIDRVRVSARERKRIAEALETAFEKGHGLARLIFTDDEGPSGETNSARLVSESPGCVDCDFYQKEPLSPRMFSFNSHQGACRACAGLGKRREVDPALLVAFPDLPLLEGALLPGRVGQSLARKHSRPWSQINAFAKREGIPLEKPFSQLTERQRDLLLFGDGQRLDYTKRRAWGGGIRPYRTTFRGLTGIVNDWIGGEKRDKWLPLAEDVLGDVTCSDCKGERLQPAYLAVTIGGKNITAFCVLTVTESLETSRAWNLDRTEAQVAVQPRQEIESRLGFLQDVGLGYLTLGREAMTLSGGEAQRIRLASQLGSALVGVLYVLDEPTIGLHQRDTRRLLSTLKRLRDLGNIVVVVEHDPETIAAADHVIDMGPGAGHLGGEVVAACSPAQLKRNKASLTGDYLSGRKRIPVPERVRPWLPDRVLSVRGARANNLRGLDVDFPLGAFTAVTGVSGSGKSSLVISVLQHGLDRLFGQRVVPGDHDAIEGWEQLEKMVVIDQSPIGKTPKSNPATYTGALDKIRALMSEMPEAKKRGYRPGRFSFNVTGGRCEACEGRGYNHIEMHFLPDVWVPCDVCDGRRYNRETLDIRFRGRNMADLMEMEIATALELFANQRGLRRILQTMVDVGLGYMKLGQAGNTLSGGEAQRLKLANQLARPTDGKTLYLLDEPTTGLHMDDIAKLLRVLHRLVDAGNTVIVIEHNLDVIKTADHVIDLGPEGGDAGGRIVATGTPAKLARGKKSHTGRALAPVLAAAETGAVK